MIETERLTLRGWREDDAWAHNALASDPRVVATLGATPTIDDSRAVVRRQQTLEAIHGHCFWVVEHDAEFAGWCGIKPGKPPIQSELEIGWTLAPALWGRGLALEAASAALSWTWQHTDRAHVAAITAITNGRSRALMERLGMIYQPDCDFEHPDLAVNHPLRLHVLYRIDRPA